MLGVGERTWFPELPWVQHVRFSTENFKTKRQERMYSNTKMEKMNRNCCQGDLDTGLAGRRS